MTPSDQAHKGRSTDKRILAFAFTVGDSCLEAIAAYNGKVNASTVAMVGGQGVRLYMLPCSTQGNALTGCLV
jgi:hypothetical protein